MDAAQATLKQDGPVRSGHKGGHMSARSQRIEVIMRGERRRRWSIEQKREIVAESLQAGVRPSEIIRKHGLSSGQLYAWRQQLAQRVESELARPAERFARVDVIADVGQASPPTIGTPAGPVTKPRGRVPLLTTPRAKGVIEIVLPDGTLVRVDGHVDDRALRRVLGVLHQR